MHHQGDVSPARWAPRTPSIQAPTRIVSSYNLGTEEDPTTGWAIPKSFPATQNTSVDEYESWQLVREQMSTGTVIVGAALNMYDGMTEQDRDVYVTSMINGNEDLTELEYEMEDTTAFVLGATSGPNPSKNKKGKTAKARGPNFIFEDFLLVKYWLDTTYNKWHRAKGNHILGEGMKDYHERNEYVEPHPIATTHNVASLQHGLVVIQREVNKYVGYYSQVIKRPQSGMGVATHTAVAVTLYHEVERKPFAFSHCWLLLNDKPKWQQVVVDLKTGKKRNDDSSFHQSNGLEDEDNDVVVTNRKAIVPKDNRQVM
ncbi:hypothetical protein D1007_23306 [Hordeum vulgare]|nr:hypothetical protein D1007_23306 [Hordeum vulgare]